MRTPEEILVIVTGAGRDDLRERLFTPADIAHQFRPPRTLSDAQFEVMYGLAQGEAQVLREYLFAEGF